VGLEGPEYRAFSQCFAGGATKSAAVSEHSLAGLPPELARIVQAWPELPEAIRQTILRIVENAG
jgi:hypothetical protein